MNHDIRNVHLTAGGWWAAELHSPGGHCRVHHRYGSWQVGAEYDKNQVSGGVLPHVASLIQDEVRTIERRMAEERKREVAAAAASGRVPAAVRGASRPASPELNGSRVPSRLSSG